MKVNSVTEDQEKLNNFESACGILTVPVDQPDLVVQHRLKVAACFIEEDIRRGILPKKITGFSEAHNYVDANMYLINEGCVDPKIGSFYEWDGWSVDRICEKFNLIIEALDKWLKDGRCMPATMYL
jgi:hypothetical protein